MPIAPTSAGVYNAPNINSPAEAAKAFEALMLKQMLNAMSKTVEKSGLFGSGFESDLYGGMFMDSIAENASGKGMGISEMLGQSFGLEGNSEASGAFNAVSRSQGVSAYRASASPDSIGWTTVSGDAEPPSNTALATLANEWLSGPAQARWGKAGALEASDISAQISTRESDGTAVFNVLDASGYEGHPKCNLFALEMIHRAGYSVPVRARSHGWGYPGASAVTKLSDAGEASKWSQRLTDMSVEQMNQVAGSGTPILLASSAPGDGHMAVADQIHSIKRNENGEIATIEYSGWEAGGKKAGYGRRVWRLASVPGKGRGGLDHIEVMEPRRSSEVFHPVGNARPGASNLDIESNKTISAQGSTESTDDY